MTSLPSPSIWPVLTDRDAAAALRFLSGAFGFEQVAAYAHARDGEPSDLLRPRAMAPGVGLVRDIADGEYGSRGFTATDPEGDLWSFGTYRGETS